MPTVGKVPSDASPGSGTKNPVPCGGAKLVYTALAPAVPANMAVRSKANTFCA